MKSPLDELSDDEKEKLRECSQPKWKGPMLATLTDGPFSDENWIFERKLDGERCMAFRKGRRVRLLSRNKKDLNGTYPELVEALEKQKADDFIADGEVVAFDGKVTSFSRLQGRMQIKDTDEARESSIAVYYYLFDLPYLAGHDTTELALTRRKQLLKKAISFKGRLRFSAHRSSDGKKFFEEARKKGWEGLIAKKSDSKYVSKRTRDWLKVKCGKRQEFVIGGYTEPQGARKGFGALLIGYYENGDLRYAGKVGTGYDEETLERLGKKLESIERKESPFAEESISAKGVHWVAPKMVAEVGFTEWTGGNRLRHPRFIGLRRDKNPKKVVREEA